MSISNTFYRSVRPVLACLAVAFATYTFGQELEPRALSMVPVRGNFVIGSYAYSGGNILVDETLPITDLKAHIHSFIGGYAHSFKLFKQLAKVDAVVPYSLGKWTGALSQVDTFVTRSGLSDPTVRISMILIGGPALSMAEFAQQKLSKFRLGAFFRVRMPLGEYDETKLINLGANRWGFKTGIGALYRLNKFAFEGYINAWWFTDNDEFLVDNVVSQSAVLTFQGHMAYLMKKGRWLALSIGQSGLGETTVNGVPQENNQNSWKFALTFSMPIKQNQALQLAFTNGLSARYGANFNTIAIVYKFLSFGKPR